MKFFKKLFGKEKQVQPDKKENSTHKEDWDFYFSNVDDIIGSFYLNLGLNNVAPIIDKPNLVWISLSMNSPREDGLSSSEEFPILSEIEDRLVSFMTKGHSAIYAGRLTSNGNRDFYFYIGDATFYQQAISETMATYPSYSFESGIKEDKEWKLYFEFMYPDPEQFQSLLNRRVVDNLEKQGDPLTKARPVDHWIYFKTETDRGIFLSDIEHLNFTISGQDQTSFGDNPFSLQISRVDYIDHRSVDEYVLELWKLAKKCNGDYDGWETTVEKE